MTIKALKSKSIVTALVLVLGLIFVGSVYASGDSETTVDEKTTCVTPYGGVEECTTEKVEETVYRDSETHETVEAGIEDVNWMAIAGFLGLSAVALLGISKFTNKVYLLD